MRYLWDGIAGADCNDPPKAMQILAVLAALAGAGLVRGDGSADLLTDINVISNYWGQVSPHCPSPLTAVPTVQQRGPGLVRR